MSDSKYCYPNSDTLINKFNITDNKELFEIETELTSIRMGELQNNPLKGDFDFNHLRAIHKYIFQDIYKWAGDIRTVEIGKGNLFCTVACIEGYAKSVFDKYYSQCYAAKDDFDEYIRVFSNNYGDLNALHPFREGNGRTQREFARLVCLQCGYDFDLSCTTHKEMLEASILNFEKGDSSAFIKIFSKAVTLFDNSVQHVNGLKILTMDDLTIGIHDDYVYYEYGNHKESELYNRIYEAKISKMNAEKTVSDLKQSLNYKVKTESNLGEGLAMLMEPELKEAENKGREEEKLNTVKNMLVMGFDIDTIKAVSGAITKDIINAKKEIHEL